MKIKELLEENNDNSDNKCPKSTIGSSFFSMPPKQFALLSSLLGILLVDNLNIEQQNSIGNFIVNIGQSILTAAAQGEAIKTNNEKNDKIRKQIEELKKELCELEKELN